MDNENSGKDKLKDVYPEYETPKSVAHCLKIAEQRRKLSNARREIAHKLLNRHGKLRK